MTCLAHYNQTTGVILGRFSPKLTYQGGIPQPVFELTDEQSEEYDLKGQRHIIQKQEDGTLAFVYVVPPEPTAEELQAQDIAALDAEYKPQFASLAQAWAVASMAKNTDIAAAREANLTALQAEYDQKRSDIENGS